MNNELMLVLLISFIVLFDLFQIGIREYLRKRKEKKNRITIGQWVENTKGGWK